MALTAPVYAGTSDLPESYKVPGRKTGYTRESVWWAFNRLSTLTAQRWGDMRHDVEAKWEPMQTELFENQSVFEKEALAIHKNNPEKVLKFLTDYSLKWGQKITDEAWRLGDFLWTKYDEKF